MELTYCVACGGILQADGSDGARRCVSCSRVHYKNPKTAASIYLFTEERELLLGVRAREPQKGKMNVIGGFVDVGETLEEALYREIKEETGLEKDEVSSVNYVGSGIHPYQWGEDTFTVLVAFYVGWLKRRPSQSYDDVESFVYKLPEKIVQEDFAWEVAFNMLENAVAKIGQYKL